MTRQTSRCYLCNKTADTDEHIPPKCFFPKPRPTLVTVRACLKCNQSFSELDDAMRAFFSTVEDASPSAKAVVAQKVFSPNSTKRAAFRSVAKSYQELRVRSANGERRAGVIKYDRMHVDRFVARVVRGLICHHYPNLHNHLARVELVLLSGIKRDPVNPIEIQTILLNITSRMERFAVGEGVLDYWIAVTPQGAGIVTVFYGKTIFYGVYSLPGQKPIQKTL